MPRPTPLADLYERACSGDQHACALLFQQYEGVVRQEVMHRARDLDPGNLIADVREVCLKRIRGHRGGLAAFANWLRIVTRNKIVTTLRRERGRRRKLVFDAGLAAWATELARVREWTARDAAWLGSGSQRLGTRTPGMRIATGSHPLDVPRRPGLSEANGAQRYTEEIRRLRALHVYRVGVDVAAALSLVPRHDHLGRAARDLAEVRRQEFAALSALRKAEDASRKRSERRWRQRDGDGVNAESDRAVAERRELVEALPWPIRPSLIRPTSTGGTRVDVCRDAMVVALLRYGHDRRTIERALKMPRGAIDEIAQLYANPPPLR